MGCISKLRDGRAVIVSLYLVDIFKYPQLYVFSQTIKNRNIFVAREDKNNRVIW